ncbi:MAG: hypothetical protein AAGE52_31060 [Myxococcota bacterium]
MDWDTLRRMNEDVSFLELSEEANELLASLGIQTISDLLDQDRAFFPREIADEVDRALTRENFIVLEEDHAAQSKPAPKRDAVRSVLRMVDAPNFATDENTPWDEYTLDGRLEKLGPDEIPQVLQALRKGHDPLGTGKHRRRLAAIVRLAGPGAPEVAIAQRDPKALQAVLEVLFQQHPPRTTPLPMSLFEPAKALLESGAGGYAAHALCWIPNPEAAHVLFRHLETTRRVMHSAAILGCAAFDACEELPATALERYREASERLSAAHAHRPEPRALRIATVIAALAKGHAEIGELTLRFYHRLPIGKDDPAVAAPFTRLLAASAPGLSAKAQNELAALLKEDQTYRYPAGAAGWAALEDAEAFAATMPTRGRTIDVACWEAMVSALRASARTDLETFFETMAVEGPGYLRAIATSALRTPSTERIQVLIERAFDAGEFAAALKVAAENRAAVARAALIRLRESKFPLEEGTLSLLAAILTDDDVDFLDQEIDGENPFRARREALQELRDTL